MLLLMVANVGLVAGHGRIPAMPLCAPGGVGGRRGMRVECGEWLFVSEATCRECTTDILTTLSVTAVPMLPSLL